MPLLSLNYTDIGNFPTGDLAGRYSPGAGQLQPITLGSGLTLSAGGVLSAASPTGFLLAANNLSDVASIGTARTNLGLGTAAVQASGFFAQVANNLSDLISVGTARTNLGLGSSATHPSTDFVLSSTLAQPSGVATLDVTGVLNSAQIPSIAVTTYLGSAASQAAMLALTGQEGDWCIRTDLGTTWVITGSDPTQLSNWTQLSYPTAPVTSVAGRTGVITLSNTDISGLGTLATQSGTFSGTSSGTNTGDQTTVSGNAGSATVLATARTLWGQSFNGSADITGSLTAVGNITGGASSMILTAGTGNSRTLTFKTTTSGGAATTALTLGADQSAVFAGNAVYSVASIVSVPAVSLTGAWYVAGSATTTKPHLLIEPTGTTSTGWLTSGTGLGINNAFGGSLGCFLDLQNSGVSKFSVVYNASGLGGTAALGIGIQQPADVVHIVLPGTIQNAFRIVTPSTTLGAYCRILYSDNSEGLYWGLDTNAGGSNFTGGASKAGYFGTALAHSVQFGTNSVIRQTIDANGNITFTQGIQNAASPTAITITGAAHTACVATGEVTFANFAGNQTVTWATGTVASNRWVRIQAPTPAFVGTSTITNWSTFDISGGAVTGGANATITNNYAFTVGGATSPVFGVNSVGASFASSSINLFGSIPGISNCTINSSGINYSTSYSTEPTLTAYAWQFAGIGGDNPHTYMSGGAIGTNGVYIGSSSNLGWVSTSNARTGTRDTGLSRISAGVIGIGTGAQGSVAGTLQAGDIKVATVGKGIYVKEGSNATMGTGTLTGGTATISTTKVMASSRIFLTDTGGGVLANIGALSVGTVVAGTSFVVNSSNVLDSSNIAWIIIEPA